MNFIKNNLANGFTLANLFSGCIGIVHLFQGQYEITAICILLSLLFDFFDGFVARLLKANSELGVQLDSLADMVSFGFLPGVAMYKLLEGYTLTLGSDVVFELSYFGFFITLMSCLRLAIFNLDDSQSYHFVGLNTPTNTLLIFGLYYTFQTQNSFLDALNAPWILVGLTALSSYLLVSPIKMFALKFKSFTLGDNLPKILLLLGSIALLLLFKTVGIPLIVVYYIVLSLAFQKTMN
ncbi:CDP-alcohol phosphatidyltransferase family protein [Chryseobacterium sp. A321]